MTCFWEGRAIVEIEVNSTEVFELVTCTDKPNCQTAYSVKYLGYDIELLEVMFNKDNQYGVEKNYSIAIVVSK